LGATQGRGRRREDGSEARGKVLRFAQVDLRRGEVRVAGTLHDLERLIATDGAPRDPGRAQVVERDGLARGVSCEQVRTLDAGALQIRAQFA
jgi:hypothetical protein